MPGARQPRRSGDRLDVLAAGIAGVAPRPAGLVLTAVLVPVGIASAVASGVPAITGLYATISGLLAYALFGP